jgi:hypothetical protein
MSLAAGV